MNSVFHSATWISLNANCCRILSVTSVFTRVVLVKSEELAFKIAIGIISFLNKNDALNFISVNMAFFGQYGQNGWNNIFSFDKLKWFTYKIIQKRKIILFSAKYLKRRKISKFLTKFFCSFYQRNLIIVKKYDIETQKRIISTSSWN